MCHSLHVTKKTLDLYFYSLLCKRLNLLMRHAQGFYLDIGWQVLLKDLGIQSNNVLRRAKLPDDLFQREKYELTTEQYFHFWNALETEAGNAMFPLQIIEKVSTESFNPPLFAALCSTNLMQATQRLSKYKLLVAPMHLDIQIGKQSEMTISPYWLSAQTEIPYSLQVTEIALFLRLARLGTREAIKALRVTLPQLPSGSNQQRYQNHFGCPIQFGYAPSITFSVEDSLRPFLTANAGMWSFFEPELQRRLAELDTNASTTERVKSVLLEMLPANTATIENAAKRLGFSKRTLQRRLEDEGENFRTLVNNTRESLARYYLTKTTVSSSEIAFLLGFEDPNSFYRAFHDWTGVTPESVRLMV